MGPETKQCQNCQGNFVVESDDFDFYEKMQVPAPTWCPECRMIRRMLFRNERALYKRDCDLCGKGMVSIFAPDKPQTVYCTHCWWSDNWDPGEFHMEYDPNRNFFEQYSELLAKAPWANLIVGYSTLVNSDYVNHAGYLKNCYFVFNADRNENINYAVAAIDTKDSMDLNEVTKSELCYQDINCHDCYQTHFSEDCSSCSNVFFSKDLSGCTDCFGCVGLRNRKYCFFNEELSKEAYEAKMAELRLSSHQQIQKVKGEVHAFWKKFPNKFMHGVQNVDVSGDYVRNSKNAHHMYLSAHAEDSKYSQWITTAPAKDVYDCSEWGNGLELGCDSMTVGEGIHNVAFSFGAWDNCRNIGYSTMVVSCSNMFGCANMRKKSNCILNKQYSEGEFKELREKIIADMRANPYVDKKGRTYGYGEFFPVELAVFGYNETSAHQYYPLTKEQALEKGYNWYDAEPSKHQVTKTADDLPDDISEVTDDILKEVIECEGCKVPFRIVSPELDQLRRFGFPLPRKCSACRNLERLNRINRPRLHKRTCQCAGAQSDNGVYQNTANHPHHGSEQCQNTFETSFDPDRNQIVYCEQCYQGEVT